VDLPEHLRPVRGSDGVLCFTPAQADQILALYPDEVSELKAANGMFLAAVVSRSKGHAEFDVLGRIECPTV
jgi:hypothetical protein